MTEQWNYPKISIPAKHGEHYYFGYNNGLQDHAVQYKIKEKNTFDLQKEDLLEGTEVFIDPNTFSEDATASLAGGSFSEDGKYYAYKF